jgi:hypothetical protein
MNRDEQYKRYLKDHISGVKKVYEEFFKPILLTYTGLSFEEINKLKDNIENHDKSKYDAAEWNGYLNWFYADEEHPQDQNAFDLAWLRHQHLNPHHWQHWILHKDSGNIVLMDMPEIYVIEMLCDWHSFSYKNKESTAWNWWEKNKDNMSMSEKTIELVEKYIWLFKKGDGVR